MHGNDFHNANSLVKENYMAIAKLIRMRECQPSATGTSMEISRFIVLTLKVIIRISFIMNSKYRIKHNYSNTFINFYSVLI